MQRQTDNVGDKAQIRDPKPRKLCYIAYVAQRPKSLQRSASTAQRTVQFQCKDHSGSAAYGNKSFLFAKLVEKKNHTHCVGKNAMFLNTSACTLGVTPLHRYTVNIPKYT
jgi:hypothetical protein